MSGNKSLILIIKNLITYSIFLLVFAQLSVCYSQTDSLEVHNIKGKEYYIHIVEKGESLYAIGKKYDVPLPVIKKENPGIADGLSIGEKVFIPVKRSETSAESVDGNFIMHTVEKKQTLYSISKLYDVQQKEIIAVNPELSDGLKEGQTIKIPVNQLKNEPRENIKIDEPKYPTHTVKAGETLYSLSKSYDVSIEAIKEANNGLSQGLREGETIYIPKAIKDNQTKLGLDSLKRPLLLQIDSLIIKNKKSEYTIALMLPFYLDENDEMVEKRNALEDKKIYPRSKFAVEFYNGFINAVNEISSDSCKFKVYVYDTKGNDTARTKLLLTKPELKKIDLIVGPLYYTNFELVADFAKSNKIPVVSPVKQSNKILLGNPFIFKAIPSKTSIIEPIVSLVADSFKTENLLVVEHEKAKEKGLVDLYLNAYSKTLVSNPNDTNIYPVIKKIVINSNYEAVVNQLSATKNNVLFVPSSDQSFVTSFFSYLITTLNKRNYEDYIVTLIGLEEWEKFENIDLDYYQRLNVHYCSPVYVNENDTTTELFVKDFIEENKIYPSKNTLLGYDLGSFYANSFTQYGTLFSEEILKPYTGKSINLNFIKTGIESGFENKNTNLLRFYDYSIQKLR